MRAFGDNAHAAMTQDRLDSILPEENLSDADACIGRWTRALNHRLRIVARPNHALNLLQRVGFRLLRPGASSVRDRVLGRSVLDLVDLQDVGLQSGAHRN